MENLKKFAPPLGINIKNMRGSKKKFSCVTKPKSLKEMSEIIKSSKESVLMIHKHGCPHCESVAPFVEKACEVSEGSGISFMHCPVEDPHCAKLATSMKIQGVPVVLGMRPTDTPIRPKWKVDGANMDLLKAKLGSTIQQASEDGGGDQPQPQPIVQRQMPPPQYTVGQLASNIIGQSVPPPPPNHVGMAQFNASRNTAKLCTPHVDCDEKEFNKKFVDFMSSGW